MSRGSAPPKIGDPDHRPLISVLIPCLNEEANVERAYRAIVEVFESLAQTYRWEIVFTDNHSIDRTFELLSALARRDERVKVIRFSRNFGYQRSILTGYLNASGDAAIQVDCDLQDPPTLIPEFLNLWRQGNLVVYGVRRSREGDRKWEWARKLFYRLIAGISQNPLPLDAGDFRLIDRRIIEELRLAGDANPYLRGEIAAIGFRQAAVSYDRHARAAGQSKFGMRALFGLALDGLLNHSLLPLRVATFTGICLAGLTLLGILWFAVGRYAFGRDWPAGFATTTVLILFSITLNAFFLGILGEYIGRIFVQTKRRPLVVVEQNLNLQGPVHRPGSHS
jgi:dolichol-phosphate mannosyltransferase